MRVLITYELRSYNMNVEFNEGHRIDSYINRIVDNYIASETLNMNDLGFIK